MMDVKGKQLRVSHRRRHHRRGAAPVGRRAAPRHWHPARAAHPPRAVAMPRPQHAAAIAGRATAPAVPAPLPSQCARRRHTARTRPPRRLADRRMCSHFLRCLCRSSPCRAAESQHSRPISNLFVFATKLADG